MNIVKRDGKLLVDSREVAEMVGKRHTELLRSIGGYIDILLNAKMRSVDFFIENSYQDSTGRNLPCYLLTRKGCDMVANKMTGEKGVLFTAHYVTKFEKMERELVQPKTQLEVLRGTVNQLIEHEQRLDKVEKVVSERITLDHGQQTAIHHQIKKRIESIYPDYEEQYKKMKLYAQLHSHLRRAFQAPKYIFIKAKDFEDAMNWIKSWRPLI